MTKWVYRFGDGAAEGRADMKNLLGGKGAGLAEMSNLGLPVPPGFTITTEVCTYFYAHGKSYPPELREQVADGLAALERSLGARFGDADNPLLVSVRSGARVSMPGMMDTVLNLGLNDRAVVGLARSSGDERFAYDSYRRFIQMYGQVVLGIDHHHFEELLENHKLDSGAMLDTDLSAEDWKTVVAGLQGCRRRGARAALPAGPGGAAVGRNRRRLRVVDEPARRDLSPAARHPRRLGNGGQCPGDGVRKYGAGLRDGRRLHPQSFDRRQRVLRRIPGQCAGRGCRRRDPHPAASDDRRQGGEQIGLAGNGRGDAGGPRRALRKVRRTLEDHYRDMQDIEFTVQRGKLWMLQTRTGKRTAQAALKIAVSLVEEGVIDRDEAVRRVEPASLDQLLHPMLDPKAKTTVLARGLPASPGAASGKVVFSADEAESLAVRGEAVILVRIETSPEDIHGMHAAKGVLTTRGGMTSHAAVVARGMGRPCVAGAGDLRIDYAAAHDVGAHHTWSRRARSSRSTARPAR